MFSTEYKIAQETVDIFIEHRLDSDLVLIQNLTTKSFGKYCSYESSFSLVQEIRMTSSYFL